MLHVVCCIFDPTNNNNNNNQYIVNMSAQSLSEAQLVFVLVYSSYYRTPTICFPHKDDQFDSFKTKILTIFSEIYGTDTRENQQNLVADVSIDLLKRTVLTYFNRHTSASFYEPHRLCRPINILTLESELSLDVNNESCLKFRKSIGHFVAKQSYPIVDVTKLLWMWIGYLCRKGQCYFTLSFQELMKYAPPSNKSTIVFVPTVENDFPAALKQMLAFCHFKLFDDLFELLQRILARDDLRLSINYRLREFYVTKLNSWLTNQPTDQTTNKPIDQPISNNNNKPTIDQLYSAESIEYFAPIGLARNDENKDRSDIPTALCQSTNNNKESSEQNINKPIVNKPNGNTNTNSFDSVYVEQLMQSIRPF